MLKEKLTGVSGPFFFGVELLKKAGLCSAGADHFDRGDASMNEEVTLRVNEPPAVFDFFYAEEASRAVGARGNPTEAAQLGVRYNLGKLGEGSGWFGRPFFVRTS